MDFLPDSDLFYIIVIRKGSFGFGTFGLYQAQQDINSILNNWNKFFLVKLNLKPFLFKLRKTIYFHFINPVPEAELRDFQSLKIFELRYQAQFLSHSLCKIRHFLKIFKWHCYFILKPLRVSDFLKKSGSKSKPTVALYLSLF